jgi:hypothetical protein
MAQDIAPLIIGATGGSGTRVVARLTRHAGYDLGRNLNDADGWKAPRSIYLLPFLYAQYPGLKFIHVLRDGRDMAFSKNQNQLRKHGPQVLNWRERWFNAEPVRSILLWARVNIGAAEFGETRLTKAYLAVRFEDLCAEPIETTARIIRFLGDDLDVASIARAEIAPPRSTGRWRRQPPAVVSKLEQAAQTALRKFGYLD